MMINDPDSCYTPSLISFDDAVKNILDSASAIDESEFLTIDHCLSRVLADDIVSTINVPGYDNSAMDGYAVNTDDCASDTTLKVTQRIPAGTTGVALEKGCAARIFTGAPIPDNANAVIMQEQCSATDDTVNFQCSVKQGQNIRKAGEDIQTGSVILSKGRFIRPQELGLIASVGVANISVVRKLCVAVFFTGDELVLPGNALADGQIYNSNQFTLCALLEKMHCDVINLGIVPDTLEDTLTVIKKACSQADLIITSGGVSVGEEDYVRVALEQLGQLSLWRIAMKPGKPVAFGNIDNVLFMGLPGNPVSVFVTYLLFARPLILKLQNRTDNTHTYKVKAGFDWKAGNRQEYLRVRIDQTENGDVLKLYPYQGSGILSSASWADGLVEIKINENVNHGDLVKYMPFNELNG